MRPSHILILVLVLVFTALSVEAITDLTLQTPCDDGCANGEAINADVPNDIVTKLNALLALARTWDSDDDGVVEAALALSANGANCSAGSYALGVDASGAAESCTDATTEIDAVVATKSAATSTDNAVPKFDSTAGDVQNSGVLIDDSNNLTVPGSITSGGTEVPTCIIMRDSDDGGDSACSVLNGTFSCETDTNGVCDDAT